MNPSHANDASQHRAASARRTAWALALVALGVYLAFMVAAVF